MSSDDAANCVFCKLIDGKLPSWRVYEDDRTVAFLDKAQFTRGHTLVVPRHHAENKSTESPAGTSSFC
jgi:histidine triad (HIT) family protein